MTQRRIAYLVLVSLSAALPMVALSAVTLTNPIQTNSISELLARLLSLIALIAFPIIVLFIVYIGFLFVTSRGNPEKLTKAREYLLYAIIGALLVLGAEALSLAIQATVEQL